MKLNNNLNSETDLWNQFLEGDRIAFARIYDLHVQKLFCYGMKLSPDKGFVMDCIHDLFVYLFKNRKTISGTNHILFYLVRSLRNNMNHRLARQLDHINNFSNSPECSYCEQTVEELDYADYTRSCLQKAIDQLSQRQKEIIHLRYFDNFSNEEIAKIMDINYQSVRNLLHLAIKSLRQHFLKKPFLSSL